MIAPSPFFDQSARLDLRRYPATRDGYERLCELADASGVVLLTGGVRGWAETIGCSYGYPKTMLRQLEGLGYVDGIEYYPGEGGLVAEVHLHRPDRSLIESEPPLPVERVHEIPHQDAGEESADRSLIESPHTPLYGTHDSKQQQQHEAHTVSAGTDRVLTQQLLAEFPQADRALLAAWEANPRVNKLDAAREALAGFPRATLSDWQTDLANAEAARARGIAWPEGLVLACWSRGERVSPPRSKAPSPPPERPTRPVQRGREVLDTTAARAWIEQQGGIVNAPPAPTPGAAPAPRQDPELIRRWQAALVELRQQLAPGEFDVWLRETRLVALAGDEATIAAPQGVVAGLGRYQRQIRRALGDVLGGSVQVRIVTATPAAD